MFHRHALGARARMSGGGIWRADVARVERVQLPLCASGVYVWGGGRRISFAKRRRKVNRRVPINWHPASRSVPRKLFRPGPPPATPRDRRRLDFFVESHRAAYYTRNKSGTNSAAARWVLDWEREEEKREEKRKEKRIISRQTGHELLRASSAGRATIRIADRESWLLSPPSWTRFLNSTGHFGGLKLWDLQILWKNSKLYTFDIF